MEDLEKLSIPEGAERVLLRTANSELWRYDGTNCALFMFLYRERDSFQLRHMETLPRGAQSATDETCLSSVKARFTPAS